MNEEKITYQKQMYAQMILDQLLLVAEEEYKQMEESDTLAEYVQGKSQQMIDELLTILPQNPTVQDIAIANEIVIHHHIAYSVQTGHQTR